MTLVYTLLARLMPTATVDRAVRGLNKFAQALAAAEKIQNDRASAYRDQAKFLETQAAEAEAEALRASRVRDRIAAFTA